MFELRQPAAKYVDVRVSQSVPPKRKAGSTFGDGKAGSNFGDGKARRNFGHGKAAGYFSDGESS